MDDFKKWLDSHEQKSELKEEEILKHKFIGCEVEPRVSTRKLLEKAESEEDVDVVIDDFVENGGQVVDIDGRNLIIEVSSGIFSLPRFCVNFS